MSVPQIVATSSGPAVTHSSDFTVVSAYKPTSAGEILSLFATGLGPTRPGVDPGQPFPSNPPPAVNSPVEVMVNGAAAEVLAAEGISIDAVLQLPHLNWRYLPFVITVEPATEQSVRAAIARMLELKFLIEPPLALPMEESL